MTDVPQFCSSHITFTLVGASCRSWGKKSPKCDRIFKYNIFQRWRHPTAQR